MLENNQTYTSTTYQQPQPIKKATLYGVTLENYTPQEIADLKRILDLQFKQDMQSTVCQPHISTSPTVDPNPWYRYGTKISDCVSGGTISGFIPDGYIVT